MLLCKKIKIEVSQQDAEALGVHAGQVQGFVQLVGDAITRRGKWNVYDAKKSLHGSKEVDPEINYVYGKLLHEVYFRLDRACKLSSAG